MGQVAVFQQRYTRPHTIDGGGAFVLVKPATGLYRSGSGCPGSWVHPTELFSEPDFVDGEGALGQRVDFLVKPDVPTSFGSEPESVNTATSTLSTQ
ncbi:hypothetical protein B2J88_50250 [Rhodococcus sp. SRB_17]|nr:hypothetical protein [Rhodococcus sp. SRB_17]